MKSDKYIVIQGWMCNELNLGGNNLLVFALIHGFSLDEVSKFSGGRKYIAETFNISLPTVDKALSELVELDYVIKEPSKDFRHTDSYRINFEVVKKLYEGSKETLLGGSKETLHKNIYNKTKNKISLSKDKDIEPTDDTVDTESVTATKKKKPSLYERCVTDIQSFTEDDTLRDMLVQALKMFLENSRETGRPMYSNMFKGKLNELKKLSTNTDKQICIVQQTLDNGWNNFYEIKTNNSRNRSAKDIEHLRTMTDDDIANKEDMTIYEKF